MPKIISLCSFGISLLRIVQSQSHYGIEFKYLDVVLRGESVSIELITFLYFGCLFIGLFLGLPVALGLGGTAVLFAAIFEPRSLLAIPSAFY